MPNYVMLRDNTLSKVKLQMHSCYFKFFTHDKILI